MHFLFLKALITSLKKSLNIIYIDETGCFLQNDNYKDWISKEETFYGGAKTGLKGKINIICAISLKGIIHYKLVDINVNSEIYGNFINELCEKLSEQEIKNSLFICDNASCHKTKLIKEKCKKEKIKNTHKYTL